MNSISICIPIQASYKSSRIGMSLRRNVYMLPAVGESQECCWLTKNKTIYGNVASQSWGIRLSAPQRRHNALMLPLANFPKMKHPQICSPLQQVRRLLRLIFPTNSPHTVQQLPAVARPTRWFAFPALTVRVQLVARVVVRLQLILSCSPISFSPIQFHCRSTLWRLLL